MTFYKDQIIDYTNNNKKKKVLWHTVWTTNYQTGKYILGAMVNSSMRSHVNPHTGYKS